MNPLLRRICFLASIHYEQHVIGRLLDRPAPIVEAMQRQVILKTQERISDVSVDVFS